MLVACVGGAVLAHGAMGGLKPSPAAVPAAQGKLAFVSNCGRCHGTDGRGGEHAPDIATAARVQQLSNAELVRLVQNGIPASGMPSFTALGPAAIEAVVAYLRVLQGEGRVEKASGDSHRGGQLFFGTARCSDCHMVRGEGGFLGSDLSDYARSHSVKAIRQAIVDPYLELRREGEAVTAVTRDGQKLVGLARNEDNFSLQLQTLDGNFHLLLKPELAAFSRDRRSLMPSDYAVRLSARDLDDLVSFLASLGAGPVDPTTAPPQRTFELRAIAPQFWSIVPREVRLTKLATGFGFTEGPVWDARGFLYVSDEMQNKIYRLHEDGRREEVVALGDPDGNTYDLRLSLIDCASALRAIIRVSEAGMYTVLADRYQGKRFNSPNDVVVGPDKAIYFTDPTLDLPKGQSQEISFQGVYRLGARGDVRLLTKDLTQPNGLAFSPDGTRLYVDDSEERNIRAYAFHAASGAISDGRIFGEEKGSPGDGVPDGMRIDTKGELFVTGPYGIWVWDGEGHHLGTIVIPEQPANLAWGGRNYDTLYITATTSVYRLRTRVRGFVPYLVYAHK
jgi:gluconolactonase